MIYQIQDPQIRTVVCWILTIQANSLYACGKEKHAAKIRHARQEIAKKKQVDLDQVGNWLLDFADNHRAEQVYFASGIANQIGLPFEALTEAARAMGTAWTFKGDAKDTNALVGTLINEGGLSADMALDAVSDTDKLLNIKRGI